MFELIFSHPAGIVLYLDVISLIAAAVTVYGKKQARTHGRRAPERGLFTPVILGGSSAMLVTVHIIRHKTRHRRFMLDLPLVTLTQLVTASLVYQSTR